MKILKIKNILIVILIFVISCKKENSTPADTHPFAGTVRLYEEKRNHSLKFIEFSTTNGYFSTEVGTEELIEFLPGKNKDQYFIRPKDYPNWCLDYSTRYELFLKPFHFNGSDAQLFIIRDIGNNRITIQNVVDTSLYVLNNTDYASASYSSFLKQRATDPNSLYYWIIEKL